MTRYAAFLRAINTGQRRLTNDALLTPFQHLGYRDPTAYQAAGNVVFDADEIPDPATIEAAFIERLGISASTLPVAELEGRVGPMTIRTLGTIERMIAKFDRSS